MPKKILCYKIYLDWDGIKVKYQVIVSLLTNILSKESPSCLDVLVLRQSMIAFEESVGHCSSFACLSARWRWWRGITIWEIGEPLIEMARWNNPGRTNFYKTCSFYTIST